MDTLDISEIERSAAVRLEIARKAKELALLIELNFPGFGVYIEKRNGQTAEPVPTRASLKGMAGAKQVATVLREAAGPMSKRDILREIESRGGTVGLDTLTSYLSRYDQFVPEGNGIWRLKDYVDALE
jgi:hypothetical protein